MARAFDDAASRPQGEDFLKACSLFAEGFARTLPLVFGPYLVQRAIDSDRDWPRAALGWGLVCTAFTAGSSLGLPLGRWALKRSIRASALHTPLLDSHLAAVVRTHQEDAGAMFSFLGLVSLAGVIFALGWCRSIWMLCLARAAAGFLSGALVGRWDRGQMAGGTHPSWTAHDPNDDPAGRTSRLWRAPPGRDDADEMHTGLDRLQGCNQAASAAWLLGFTFGPLLGIFFQQRAFSHWRSTLKLPSRVKALPAALRFHFPALPPCIGGFIILVALALLVLCETGIRWLKCNKSQHKHGGAGGKRAGRGWRCWPCGSVEGEGAGAGDEGRPLTFDGADEEAVEEEAELEDDPRLVDFLTSFGKRHGPAKFQAMLDWRESFDVPGVLRRPHPHWTNFKKAYPFYLHGRAKSGELVTYEQPGKMNISDAIGGGMTTDHLRHMYTAIHEFITLIEQEYHYGEAPPLPGQSRREKVPRVLSIVDVGGLKLRDLNKDTFSFLLTASEIMNSYYPERVGRIMLVNAPFWFAGAWSGVSNMLPANVTDKVRICSSSSTEAALLPFVDEAQLPVEYYSGGQLHLGEWPDEQRLNDLVCTLNGEDPRGAPAADK